jgi:serine phosphatase RsbU (regulator of sigma subunit)
VARGSNEGDIRVGGMKLGARFALTTSAAVVVVMSVAGFLLYNATNQATQEARDTVIRESMILTAKEGGEGNYSQVGSSAADLEGELKRFTVSYGTEDQRAHLYKHPSGANAYERLLVPIDSGDKSQDLLGLILGIVMFVLIVVAFVSFFVANQVSRPLEKLVNDIRQIAKGDFSHRTRVEGGGEIALLARTVDRMAAGLAEAQDAEIDFEMKEREMEVAAEVLEAFLPQTTPQMTGYDIAGVHMGSPEPGGDFHDFVEIGDSCVGLLVCGVSGKGVPGALVGATARAYLRTELAGCGDDIEGAFKRVNRVLAGDVRRGMYVTALYVLIDTSSGETRLACAGHKVPLIRRSAADGKLQTIQPEGIALGFDKGSIFDRTLQISNLKMEPGDRLILANTGPAQVMNEEEEPIGDKGFYRLLLKLSGETSKMMLDGVLMGLESYAGEEPYPNDLAIVTVCREG